MTHNRKKAVVLSSGGLDSTTVMAIARHQEYDLFSLSFDYGQRHKFELKAAKINAALFNAIQHLIIDINMRRIGGSALTDDIDVPKAGDAHSADSPIPVTYVPARNTIFLSYALAWAEVLGARDIFIGVTAVDYSGYPDCRPEFITAFAKMANLATKAGVEGDDPFEIHTPLIHLSKAEIIRQGTALGVDYGLTHSCYDPTPKGLACGVCDSCILRKKGFIDANIKDPTPYQ
ncbi:MAG: 7-cyano-7-deazaguanine synthase QueC [Desulfobacteraceae bacterium]|nr:7-cyano-7-deazaguanine synthase QueC [Desulfobacteraceae bacterium]